MRIIILDEQGGEKLRTNINNIIVTFDSLFQVVNEDGIISDPEEDIEGAILSLITKIPSLNE